MRQKTLLIILIILGLCVFAQAQTKLKSTKVGTVNFPKSVGKYPFELFKNKVVKSRMKRLLGKSYADFFDSFETQATFTKKGNFLFSSGCLIHACTHLESAIAIDLTKNTIHTAIFREDEPAKYFNEKKQKTPTVLTSWIKAHTK